MRVAAIVPAFNEEKTIGNVLTPLVSAARVDEVIVVNDGSTDATSTVAHSYGVRVIDLAQNEGKGGAMLAGAHNTAADVLLYIDADLLGLTETHVDALLEPVLSGRAHMTIGVFSEGRLTTDLAQRITPFLSGQRAMVREIIDNVPNLDKVGYGVEVAISRYVQKHKLKVEKVPLYDVSQVMKEEKRGFVRGVISRLRMYWEIIRSFGF